jgi:hypothetical protein
MQRKGDFFSDLGVPVSVDEKGLQSRFRRVAAQFHPDKLKNPTVEQQTAAETHFVHLKVARDTLVNPAKRYAYERFGPDMLAWKDCVTKLEFVRTGINAILPYYIISIASLLIMGFLGYAEYGTFWQYFAVAAVGMFEFHTVVRPDFPPVIAKIASPVMALLAKRPAYLPFQAIAIARRIAISVFVAVAQLAPQWKAAAGATKDTDKERQEQLNKLMATAAEVDVATTRMVQLEAVPFMGASEGSEERLKSSLINWLVHNEVRNDSGVQRALSRAIERRNRGEPEPEPVVDEEVEGETEAERMESTTTAVEYD